MSKSSQKGDCQEQFSANEQTFIDWLATPEYEREIKTQGELSERLGLARETLSRWKKRPEIINEVVSRKKELAGVSGLPKVIDAMAVRASRVTGGYVREANEATKMFLQWFYGQELGEGGVNVNVNQETEVQQRPAPGEGREELLRRIDSIARRRREVNGIRGDNGELRGPDGD